MTAIELPELDCVVYRDEVPVWAQARLPSLYQCPYATVEYFRSFDEQDVLHTVVLHGGEQILIASVDGCKARILTRFVPIAASVIDAGCRALFRVFPQVQRIHVELMGDPHALTVPWRLIETGEDYIIELPKTPDEYTSSLGRSTRQNSNQQRNRLFRQNPRAEWACLHATEVDDALIDETVDRVLDRLREQHGVTSSWEQNPRDRDHLKQLVHLFGLAVVLREEGHTIAACLGFLLGTHAWAFVHSFDPHYADYRPGRLCDIEMARKAIEQGCTHLHYGWTFGHYKTLLGAVRHENHGCTVYRSPLVKVLAIGEIGRAHV